MRQLHLRLNLIILFLFSSLFGQVQPTLDELMNTPINPSHDGIINCASSEYEAYLQNKETQRKKDADFEEWMGKKVTELKAKSLAGKITTEVINIPVIIHVIHAGQPIGQGSNITDSQILSQIQVLNEDFRRLIGTNGYNDHPDGADVEIEFCLAHTAPDGSYTTGINRYNLGFETVNMDDVENVIKPQTQWDPEKYFNIWVIPRMPHILGEILGYAQFPQAESIDGLGTDDIPDSFNDNSQTDGVAISYISFGSKEHDDGTFQLMNNYDLGRIATHEIGHYFGLRHLWGDGGCDVDDYCIDTPNCSNANYECGPAVNECGGGLRMVENYMDYSPNSCMNIFTEDQKYRIRVVLQESPRRKTLQESNVCNIPEVVGTDASVSSIGTSANQCEGEILTSTNILNLGLEPLTSLKIDYYLNGNLVETDNWSGNIPSLESENIEMILNHGYISGNNDITIKLSSINGNTEDNNLENNVNNSSFQSWLFNTEKIKLSITTDSFGSETSWKFSNKNTGEILQEVAVNTYGANQVHQYEFNVEMDQCYEFIISDAEGDGMCCSSGEGNYQLTTENGELIREGGNFGASQTSLIGIRSNMSLDENQFSNELNLYPNPSNGIFSLSLISKSTEIFYQVYDASGKLVHTSSQPVKKGKITQKLNLSQLPVGNYILRVTNGKQKLSKKILIKK